MMMMIMVMIVMMIMVDHDNDQDNSNKDLDKNTQCCHKVCQIIMIRTTNRKQFLNIYFHNCFIFDLSQKQTQPLHSETVKR